MRTLPRMLTAMMAAVVLAMPMRAAEPDPYLPDFTEAVVTLNIKQILSSPLLKKLGVEKLKDLVHSEPEVDKVLTDLGFDPFSDIDRMVTAGGSGANAERGLMILHGRFDLKKFQSVAEDAAKDHGDILKILKESDGKGGEFKLYELTIPDSPLVYVALASKTGRGPRLCRPPTPKPSSISSSGHTPPS